MSTTATIPGGENHQCPVSTLSTAAKEMPQNRKSLHHKKKKIFLKSPSGWMTQLKKRGRERRREFGKVRSGAASKAVWQRRGEVGGEGSGRRGEMLILECRRNAAKSSGDKEHGRGAQTALQGHLVEKENRKTWTVLTHRVECRQSVQIETCYLNSAVPGGCSSSTGDRLKSNTGFQNHHPV